MDDLELPQPVVGQRWIEMGVGEASWVIVKIDISKNQVGLSGPGPLRSYHVIPYTEFVIEWEPWK